MVKKSISLVILFLVIACFVKNTAAYDDKVTHPDITEKAARYSQFEQYLIQNLGFEAGLETQFTLNNKNKPIIKWLREGAELEDDPICRATNHFHNPLKPWDESYMSDDTTFLGSKIRDHCESEGWTYANRKSNITWATGYLAPAPDGQKASFNPDPAYAPINWDKAREYYYNALTSILEEDRETNFALTFNAVGHVMHLLEDVSVPAHVRNDFTSHLKFNGFVEAIVSWDYKKLVKQPFEYFMKIRPALVDATPVSPTFTDLRLTDFWDTDQYVDGGDPPTGNAIGLAEYSNANFLSLETIFKGNTDTLHGFPHPAWISVIEYEEVIDGEKWTYLKKLGAGESIDGKIGFGESIDHLAIGKRYYKYLPSFLKLSGLTLDDIVYLDYASLLIPRAVGYSAGLLDYFFRGTLEITPPDQVAYSVTDGSDTPYIDNGNLHQQFNSIKAKVRNSTPNTMPGEEVQNCNQAQQNCILQAVARYKIVPDYMYDLSNYPPDGITMQNIEYSYSVSGAEYIDNLSSTTPQEFTFDFSTNPIPTGITDLYLFVVFKGTLGNETDIAIAVGMKDLMEPTHQVLWNLTDMFSLDNHLYMSDEIRDTSSLLDRVDLDNDGQINEVSEGEPYIDPYQMTFGIGYLSEPPGPVNPFTYSAITVVQEGRHIRLVVLMDKPQDNYLVLEESNAILGTSYYYFASPGVVNQEEDDVWQTPTPMTTFRYGLDIDGITQIPIRQHFENGVLGCYPLGGTDPYGNPACSYPESEAIPAELSPSPIDTVYFP